ncbi:Putative ribonuclease H protein At1g65750, partial [Linum grandiflorum]
VPNRQLEAIRWTPPLTGWHCINTDGSFLLATGRAAAGGVLRNFQCEVQKAFSINLGVSSITRAELRGAIHGMKMAWRRGVRQLEVNINSMCVVEILNGGNGQRHQYKRLVAQFQRLRARDWDIRIIHVYLETNGFANFLVARGHSLLSGAAEEMVTSNEITFWEDYDKTGNPGMRVVVV